MIDFDEKESYRLVDKSNLLTHIIALPDQLLRAWEIGNAYALPSWNQLDKIVICGMGGSGIGADLIASYALTRSDIPVFVHHDYGLPHWARNPQSLVIISSHSGNTEEAVSSLRVASESGCKVVVLSTGGQVIHIAKDHKAPFFQYVHSGAPRTAIGYTFGIIAAVMSRLGLIENMFSSISVAAEQMTQQASILAIENPIHLNPAKRLAGQAIERPLVIIASELLAPVARRWKCQVNELAKAWAGWDAIPEANHNSIIGLSYPRDALEQMFVLFLSNKTEHPRNYLRMDMTRQHYISQGINTDMLCGKGDDLLSQMWTLIQFGDYFSYYLAMAYNIDPTPIEAIEEFKLRLQKK